MEGKLIDYKCSYQKGTLSKGIDPFLEHQKKMVQREAKCPGHLLLTLLSWRQVQQETASCWVVPGKFCCSMWAPEATGHGEPRAFPSVTLSIKD